MTDTEQRERILRSAAVVRLHLRQMLRDARAGLDDHARLALLGVLYDDSDADNSILGVIGDLLTATTAPFNDGSAALDDELESAVDALDSAASYVRDSAGSRVERARAHLSARVHDGSGSPALLVSTHPDSELHLPVLAYDADAPAPGSVTGARRQPERTLTMDPEPTPDEPAVRLEVISGPDAKREFLARAARGKQALPADAPLDDFMAQLRRAQREIDRRNGTPEAAAEGQFVIFVDEVALLARDPDNTELRELLRTVRDQGPSVDVAVRTPTPRKPTLGEPDRSRQRDELADLLAMTPAAELVSRLDELGWLEEYATLLGVTQESVAGWRDGQAADAHAHIRLARFVATCITIEGLGTISNAVAWFRTPLRPPCPHTPLDLARSDIGLELEYAAGERSAEGALDEIDELWRTRTGRTL